MNFFITGLPRSRTSWIANLLTYKASFCFHELSNYGKDFMELHDVMQTRRESYVGTADSALPFYFDPLAELCQTFHLVVIQRPIKESLENYFNRFGNRNKGSVIDVFLKTEEKIQTLINKFEPLVLQFDELEDISKVRELWYYCVPELEFDEGRFQMLNKLNVEPHVTKYMRELNTENISSIIGG